MPSVFITGASGFVGSHVAKELQAHGYTVSGLARSDSSAKKLEAAGITPVKGNLYVYDSLAAAAKAADAVIHCAFIHNFTDPNFDMEKNVQASDAAFRAMANALKGTNKPIIMTSACLGAPPGVTLTEDGEKLESQPRKRDDNTVAELAKQGIRTILMRLPPSVHGDGDPNFIPALIAVSKQNGYSQYVADGSSRWPTVDVDDAAILYRLAVEKDLPAGAVLHPIEDELVKTKDIAELIAKRLNVPTKSITHQDAINQLGFIGLVFGTDMPASKEKTVASTGWKPTRPPLLEDLANNYKPYF